VSEEDLLAAVDHVDDDVLRLMFVCYHPVLTPEAQCTLTLKLVGGLTTREIARAYLTTEATVAQRIVRAKRTLTEAGAALEEPSEAERAQRLTTVLGVIYLLFNEGYSALPEVSGCGPRCVTRRSGWGGSSLHWLRCRARCTA
jgi:predicted RNA polymerase sigma factor